MEANNSCVLYFCDIFTDQWERQEDEFRAAGWDHWFKATVGTPKNAFVAYCSKDVRKALQQRDDYAANSQKNCADFTCEVFLAPITEDVFAGTVYWTPNSNYQTRYHVSRWSCHDLRWSNDATEGSNGVKDSRLGTVLFEQKKQGAVRGLINVDFAYCKRRN